MAKRKPIKSETAYTLVTGTVVGIDITWLDGGRADDFPVLTQYPATLEVLAAALEAFTGADDGHTKTAAALRAVRSRDVVANNATRFVAIIGDALEIDSPHGKCLIEIQDLPLCHTTAFGLESDTEVAHLIDMKGVK